MGEGTTPQRQLHPRGRVILGTCRRTYRRGKASRIEGHSICCHVCEKAQKPNCFSRQSHCFHAA